MMENVKRKHFTYEDRVVLEKLLNNNNSYREISSIVGKSVSSISDEIKRNSINNVYEGNKANQKAYIRRYYSKKGCCLIMSLNLKKHIDSKLEKKWSPERISGELRLNKIRISKNCIYR